MIKQKQKMKINNLKVLGNWWFSGADGTTGIVVCFDEITREEKTYIGIALKQSEEDDIKHIVEWGCRLDTSILDKIRETINELQNEQR